MDNGDVPTPRWEAILWNDRDEVTECANGNLVVELDGVLVTPPLSSGLLPGIQREVDLERGAIVERTLTLDDLKRATRAWRINSLSGWVPLEISWGARD
jgi:para-aminobenzoate synthetase/4-amino-4-deoxychorismate lyase